MERISREDYFHLSLSLLEQRSTCMRAHVGALIVRENRIVAHGYNGAPPGMPHCLDVGCKEETLVGTGSYDDTYTQEFTVEGCARAIHAEANALAWAARNGIKTLGASMWCTYSPCRSCAQQIVSAGIAEFVYFKDYRLARVDILDDAGLEVIYLD